MALFKQSSIKKPGEGMKHKVKEDTFLDDKGSVTTDPDKGSILLARAGKMIHPALIARHGIADQLKPKKAASEAKKRTPAKNKSKTPTKNK